MRADGRQNDLSAAHAMPGDEVCTRLDTDAERGLARVEAKARLERLGPNRPPEAKRTGRFELAARQLRSPLIGLLGVAALISIAVGAPVDAAVIAVIVVLNGVIGYAQESRAETAAWGLRELLRPQARVVRDGGVELVDAEELVTGDVVTLRPGDRVAADGRLVRAWDLEVDESALTGESLPDPKSAEPPVADDAAIGDRATMAFTGTTVTRGGGRLAITATGSATQLGQAVGAAGAAGAPATPLEQRLAGFAGATLRLVAALCLLLAGLAWAYGEELSEALRIGVALAVAAVPEGLPAVLTVALAIGVQRMAGRNAIVRHLPAVETLGSTTVICTDKTGTLTEGRMSLRRLYVCGGGESDLGTDAPGDAERALLAAAGIACRQEPGPATVPAPETLTPTEAAIAQGARQHAGAGPAGREGDIVARVRPFDSDRKRMSVVVRTPQGAETSYVKGAPESLLPRLAVDESTRRSLSDRAARWAGEGTRVMLVAHRAMEEAADPEDELEPLGLIGLLDPPRREVATAIGDARRAGVRTVVVTGDHPGTAEAVAREVGVIEGDAAAVLTGSDLDGLDDAELESRAGSVSVFARVAPAHKVRIVRALQRGGDVVAMTGDGVNDVPALEAAHIGVAMGIRGTDAARGAADMVLGDDDYSTIVAAIRRGRSIYDNVVRFVHFLLAANAGEVLVFTLAIVAGLPAPLTVAQILLVNLLTDGPPAIAVGVDPPRRGIMRRAPRSPSESLLAPVRNDLVIGGLATGLGAFAAFLIGRADGGQAGQTMAFATLVGSQLAYVFAVRADGWPPRAGTNRFLYGAVAASAAIACALLALRPLHDALGLVPLTLGQLAWVAALSIIPFATLIGSKARRGRE